MNRVNHTGTRRLATGSAVRDFIAGSIGPSLIIALLGAMVLCVKVKAPDSLLFVLEYMFAGLYVIGYFLWPVTALALRDRYPVVSAGMAVMQLITAPVGFFILLGAFQAML